MVPIMVGRIGAGSAVLMSTVCSSTTTGVTFMPPKNLMRISQSMRSSSVRSIAVLTASALNGSPSWKVTPSCSSKRQVRSSIRSHAVARRGVMLPSSGSISVSVSVTFCLTMRPTLERLASHGSTMSGSSESTIVIAPSSAAATTPGVSDARATASGKAARPAMGWMRMLCLPDAGSCQTQRWSDRSRARRAQQRPVRTAGRAELCAKARLRWAMRAPGAILAWSEKAVCDADACQVCHRDRARGGWSLDRGDSRRCPACSPMAQRARRPSRASRPWLYGCWPRGWSTASRPASWTVFSRPRESLAVDQGNRVGSAPAAGLADQAAVRGARILERHGSPDVVFAFHDDEELGPRMLSRISKHTGLRPEDL